MKLLGFLKPKQRMNLDMILLLIGGGAHLMPTQLLGITSLALGPITVQMLVGALSVVSGFDMLLAILGRK